MVLTSSLHRGSALNEPKLADALAEAVVAEVKSGMIVGLGTGRAASRGILALADRVREEKLDIRCVPTSHAAETVARSQQLSILDFAMVERVDYLFDGADEVDRSLRILKGGGGAMSRERIVAWAAERCVYMVDEAKIVHRLGQRNTLAVAILPFGMSAIRAQLRNLGLHGVVRRTIKGELFLNDNAHLILDVVIGDRDLDELACILNCLPGVVDHGLFIDEADEVLVETSKGIERLIRPDDEEDESSPSCGTA